MSEEEVLPVWIWSGLEEITRIRIGLPSGDPTRRSDDFYRHDRIQKPKLVRHRSATRLKISLNDPFRHK